MDARMESNPLPSASSIATRNTAAMKRSAMTPANSIIPRTYIHGDADDA